MNVELQPVERLVCLWGRERTKVSCGQIAQILVHTRRTAVHIKVETSKLNVS